MRLVFLVLVQAEICTQNLWPWLVIAAVDQVDILIVELSPAAIATDQVMWIVGNEFMKRAISKND